jgi:hypothetical protein
MADLPPHIVERYGLSTSRHRGKVSVALGVLIGLLGIGYGYKVVKATPAHFELHGFVVNSSHRVDLTWQVARKANTTTYCVVRAQNTSRQDVGYATVTIAPGSPSTTITYPLATESTANLAEVLGCSDSAVMRVPPANFPPGVAIPVQPAPGVAPTP